MPERVSAVQFHFEATHGGIGLELCRNSCPPTLVSVASLNLDCCPIKSDRCSLYSRTWRIWLVSRPTLVDAHPRHRSWLAASLPLAHTCRMGKRSSTFAAGDRM